MFDVTGILPSPPGSVVPGPADMKVFTFNDTSYFQKIALPDGHKPNAVLCAIATPPMAWRLMDASTRIGGVPVELQRCAIPSGFSEITVTWENGWMIGLRIVRIQVAGRYIVVIGNS